MTVISSTTDSDALTLTLVAEFDAEPERVWQLWQDPRKLERWWGPPTYPATFTRHDFVVGGESRYFMTGPNGETPRGWWRIDALEPPSRLEFANGLAGEDGEPAPGVAPAAGEVTFEAVDDADADDRADALRRRRADGEDDRDGHAGGNGAGDRPDRRAARACDRLTQPL